MTYVLIHNKPFQETQYDNEDELESAVIKNKNHIFGDDIVYIDSKIKTGGKGQRNTGIPDGFLIDFSYPEKPQLFFVECELESHCLYNHIGPQIWRFYAPFDTGKRELHKKLTNALKKNKKEIEEKVEESPFDNIDSLLNFLIFDNGMGTIVVIDEQSDDFNSALNKFVNKPEVIVLKKFQYQNQTVYHYNPFREGLTEYTDKKREKVKEKFKDVDTIVCPAREDGFKHAFLDNNAWWAIRISPLLIPQLKYITMYETQPVSAIRYFAKIKQNGIQSYKNSGKYIVHVERKKKIGPIKLDKGSKRGMAPQAPRFTTHKKLMSAKKISDLW